MSKPKILIQIDPDRHASVFDSVVAIDCGIDHLISHENVNAENVVGMVHGAIFTRGMDDLKYTALFFGGSDVQSTELLVKKAKSSFFGPMKVSWMSDPNGSNTTAAAAVLSAQKHFEKKEVVTILGGTGPVGSRIARLVSPLADKVRVCSRSLEKAEKVCEAIAESTGASSLEPVKVSDAAEVQIAIHDCNVLFAAGAAGIEFAQAGWLETHTNIEVAIDLNAVPPVGLSGIDVMDKGVKRGSTICYGAIGVGGLKMKIHKQCIKSLFESNDKCLDTAEIYEVGKQF